MRTGAIRKLDSLPEDAVHVGSSGSNTSYRRHVLDLIGRMPMITDAVGKMKPGDTFRVIMSKENAHLFKQGADGLYKPFLHDGKKFVGNVDLARVSPDYVGALSNIALMVNMATIAAKLEAIEAGVRNIAHLVADTQRGRVRGAIDALALACALSGPAERRTQMISASGNLVVELGALAGQLRAHINAMPKETTGLLDGFFGSGFGEAKEAYDQVHEDVGLLIEGIRDLLRTYQDLGEAEVAREALSRILGGVKQAGLPEAIRKVRLLPFSAQVAPEAFLSSFLDAVNDMNTNLLWIDQPELPLIAIDINPEELLH